jgi:hypothetical protein
LRALLTAVAAGALAAGLAACGGGGKASTVQPNPPPVSAPSTSTQQTTTGKSPSAHAPETPTSTSGEDKPGGGGDETPAHFDASLTGRGGSIGPREVQVAPYISVRVGLRSADGQLYQLRVNGKTLAAQGSKRAQLTLAGLKPGQSYTLAQPAGGPSVKIVANAEPGP